jgi:hypothetical protein
MPIDAGREGSSLSTTAERPPSDGIAKGVAGSRDSAGSRGRMDAQSILMRPPRADAA